LRLSTVPNCCLTVRQRSPIASLSPAEARYAKRTQVSSPVRKLE
jgi:hypothetical protein